jgi:HK97 family phage major capsid protein
MDIGARIAALDETRMRVWEEAKGFLEKVPAEMSAEDRSQWERYNERIDSLKVEADAMRVAKVREDEDAALRVAEERAFVPEQRAQRANAAEDIRSWLRGERRIDGVDGETGRRINGFNVDLRGAMRERELIRQGVDPSDPEFRDLAWDATSGSLVVPTIMARTLYQKLEASVALFRMPVTRVNSDSGEPWEFPRVDTHAVATQVAGQGSTVNVGTDPVFGKLSLTPVKHAETVTLASELVTDNGVDIVSFVGADIGRALGRQIDSVEIPRMVPAAGLGSVNTGGSLIGPTYDKLIDVVYAVNDEYRNGGSAAWLFRDATVGAIRKLRDGAGGTEGAPLWTPTALLSSGLSVGQAGMLLDYPVYTDPNVASLASNNRVGAFGDWKGYFLRTVGSVQIDRDDSVNFLTDEVSFRGKWRAIGGYQDTGAVVILKQNV